MSRPRALLLRRNSGAAGLVQPGKKKGGLRRVSSNLPVSKRWLLKRQNQADY